MGTKSPYEVYGDEEYTGWLMENNFPLLDTFVFDAGVVLQTPAPPEQTAANDLPDLEEQGRNTRRAYVDLIYNGTAATAEISGFVTDISYTDPASGEADSLDITLQDRDRRWTGAWIPVAGDTLAATIRGAELPIFRGQPDPAVRFLYRGQFQFFRLAGFREHFRDLHAAGQQFHHHPADKDLGKRDHKRDRNRDRRPRRDRAGLGRGGRPVHDQERGAIGTNRL